MPGLAVILFDVVLGERAKEDLKEQINRGIGNFI